MFSLQHLIKGLVFYDRWSHQQLYIKNVVSYFSKALQYHREL